MIKVEKGEIRKFERDRSVYGTSYKSEYDMR